MCSAHPLMVLYICEKFHENISDGFQLTERTQVHGKNGYFNFQRAITPKVGKLGLRFVSSARRLLKL